MLAMEKNCQNDHMGQAKIWLLIQWNICLHWSVQKPQELYEIVKTKAVKWTEKMEIGQSKSKLSSHAV